MPLQHSSSDAAFKSNLKAELAAGKPRDQSLAIAYRVKRESRAEGGQVESGNIDLGNRPTVQNDDGTISTVRSIDVALDGKNAILGGLETIPRVLIPTISDDGRVLSDQDAVDLYNQTGRHLGKFDNAANAAAYAQRLHEEQSRQYGRGRAKGGSVVTHAMKVAYRIKREGRAAGGPSPASWQTRAEARGMTHSGPIMSAVAGRTDHHPMNVKSGAYVLPADHVSSLGQGNTASGMAVLGHMFGQSGPYGMGKNPAIKRGSGAPRAPRAPSMKMRADGGAAEEDIGAPTPINAAGGEYVIDPEIVAQIGGGDIKRGHAILDQWVIANRKNHISTLKKLPGPAKD